MVKESLLYIPLDINQHHTGIQYRYGGAHLLTFNVPDRTLSPTIGESLKFELNSHCVALRYDQQPGWSLGDSRCSSKPVHKVYIVLAALAISIIKGGRASPVA